MARNRSDAQPKKQLTSAEWNQLHELIQATPHVAVWRLCQRWGVSKARYYQRFPAKPKEGVIAADAVQLDPVALEAPEDVEPTLAA